MKITKINQTDYSPELLKELVEKRIDCLIAGREISSQNPYSYRSSGDTIQINFDAKSQEQKIDLPLQTNFTELSNGTNYISLPSFNFLKNLWSGKLQYAKPEKLVEFLEELKKVSELYVVLKQVHKKMLDRDWNHPDANQPTSVYSTTIKPQGSIENRLNEIEKKFIQFPQRFLIDPESDLRVEKRIARDGSEYFKASLDVLVYTGVSSAPGVNEEFCQAIKAQIKR